MYPKFFFDSQIQKFWKHPKLNNFLDDEAMPVFSIQEMQSSICDSDSVDFLEGIAYRCYTDNHAYSVSMHEVQFFSNPDFSQISIKTSSETSFESVQFQNELGRLLHVAFCYRLLYLGGMSLHSATVVHKDEGIAFCGLSGAGKSTQANLWKSHIGAWVLNYDKPAISYSSNGKCLIHGTPWSGKEHCFINASLPLKAIVFVEQAPYNRVEKLPLADAYSLLLLNNYVYPLNDEISNLYTQQIEKLAQAVPVYRLFCTKDSEAVRVLYEMLYGQQQYKAIISKGVKLMKIKSDYILRNVADEYIVIPRGKMALNFQATLILNETGAFLWELMQTSFTKEALVSRLLAEYDVPQELAKADVANFIALLDQHNLLENI